MRIPPVPARNDPPMRPTHFHEDQNERVGDDKQGPDDYVTEAPEAPIRYGLQPPAPAQPVFLTEPPPVVNPIRPWQAVTFILDATDSTPEKILNNDRSRDRAVLANVDAANAIYLTERAGNKNPAFARILPAGKEVEMLHNTELWAFSLVGTPNLAVHTEYHKDPQ